MPPESPSPIQITVERRRRTKEYGYRVCGLCDGTFDHAWDGIHPRVCVMPKGHTTSPHRDASGVDFADEHQWWAPLTHLP